MGRDGGRAWEYRAFESRRNSGGSDGIRYIGADTGKRRGRNSRRTTMTEGGGARKVARLLAGVSRYTHLGGTPWERHSGQTDTDIETRLPTICNIYLNV